MAPSGLALGYGTPEVAGHAHPRRKGSTCSVRRGPSEAWRSPANASDGFSVMPGYLLAAAAIALCSAAGESAGGSYFSISGSTSLPMISRVFMTDSCGR